MDLASMGVLAAGVAAIIVRGRNAVALALNMLAAVLDALDGALARRAGAPVP